MSASWGTVAGITGVYWMLLIVGWRLYGRPYLLKRRIMAVDVDEELASGGAVEIELRVNLLFVVFMLAAPPLIMSLVVGFM